MVVLLDVSEERLLIAQMIVALESVVHSDVAPAAIFILCCIGIFLEIPKVLVLLPLSPNEVAPVVVV